jgi:hypothetical protein
MRGHGGAWISAVALLRRMRASPRCLRTSASGVSLRSRMASPMWEAPQVADSQMRVRWRSGLGFALSLLVGVLVAVMESADEMVGAVADADGAGEHAAGLAAEGVGDVGECLSRTVVEVAVSW